LGVGVTDLFLTKNWNTIQENNANI